MRVISLFSAKILVAACALCVAGIHGAIAQTILYQQSFTGGDVPLHGSEPTVNNFGAGNNTWTGADIFRADGTVEFRGGDFDEGGLTLPFTPQDGAVYTLTAEFLNPGPGWLAFGFAQTAPTTALDLGNRHSNTMAGRLWALSRNRDVVQPGQNDQEFFQGAGAGNNVAGASGIFADSSNPVEIEIVLDTTDSNTWMFDVLYNGVSPLGGLQPAANTADLRNNINFVGFSKEYPDPLTFTNSPATLMSFTLESTLCPGDVTGNCLAEYEDFEIIRDNLFRTGVTRAEGDLNGDNIVDFADFREWKVAAGPLAAGVSLFGSAVPEPSTALLAALTALLVSLFRFRARGPHTGCLG